MCGICGFTGEIDNKDKIIKEMTNLITHRGPDSSGFFTDENIAMGFRRLSIIDLNQGNQPIFNEDKTLVLTFNGEIYNYKELKEELINENHTFNTDTDSEVLIHGFEQWKENLLYKLRGMFSFAIFNTVENTLFLARDFFGIKPLHYAMCNNNFLYASEIKSLLEFPSLEKRLNLKALDNYLSFQYAPAPETLFQNIYCLLPGHYLYYKNGKIEIQRYFDPKFNEDPNLSLNDAITQIENTFEDSINVHKISDVEVGCFLSSGIDSSYVSTFFEGKKAFTVGFDNGEKYNEISFADNLSKKLNIEHHSKIISPEEFWDIIPHIQYMLDQPLADPACIALYFVSNLAKDYVKVVLSGEGADELFGGYNIYHEPLSLSKYQSFVPRSLRLLFSKLANLIPLNFKGKSFISRGAKSLEERFIGNAFIFNYDDKRAILKDPSIATRPQDFCKVIYNKCQDYEDITKMQYLDINLWMLGDILLKADRMSMANSLELRVPFLDIEVFKVASRLPVKLKVNNENTKYALRKAALKRLPKATAEKKKLGFPVPIRVWLKQEKYYNIVKEAFTSKVANQFFNIDVLMAYLNSHYTGKEDNSRKIWNIYTFIVWYNMYFDK